MQLQNDNLTKKTTHMLRAGILFAVVFLGT